MTNFDKQLTAAIATYSELSGKTKEEIIAGCKIEGSAEYKHVTMLMTVVIETRYGKIEIVYVPKRPETDVDVFDAFNSGQEYLPEVKESHYIATVLDGRFECCYATATNGRKSALKNLMSLLAGQYASDLLAEIE